MRWPTVVSELTHVDKGLTRQPSVREDYQWVITTHPQDTKNGEKAEKYLVPSSLPSMAS